MHMALEPQHRHTHQWIVQTQTLQVRFPIKVMSLLLFVLLLDGQNFIIHTKDETAFSAAKCLLKHFSRFGAPHQLKSDNGPHFIADVIREFLALVGINHCLTLSYSKEENAVVERFNKEINRHLRALTFDNLSLTIIKSRYLSSREFQIPIIAIG